jgi:hypothetical protein
MNRALIVGIALLLPPLTILAAQSAEERTREFGRLPNWTGLWETEWSKNFLTASGRPAGVNEGVFIGQHVKLFGHPPYNAEWETRYQTEAPKAFAAASAAKECTAGGFPMAMEGPNVFQVVVTPEETLFVFDAGEVRHIYTDRRSHPAPRDLWPTRMGDSIGHWEGDTLVIDTVARSAGPITSLFPVAGLSEHAHFVERVHREGRDALVSRMIIEDPERLSQPWELMFTYSRVTNADRMIAVDCASDRNPVVDGKLIIAPLPH